MKSLGIMITFLAMASVALAGNVRTPEIDGNSLMSGIALATGAVMVLRSRSKK